MPSLRPECLPPGMKYPCLMRLQKSGAVLPPVRWWERYQEVVNGSGSVLPQVIEFTQSKFITLPGFNGHVPAGRTKHLGWSVFVVPSLTFCCHLVVIMVPLQSSQAWSCYPPKHWVITIELSQIQYLYSTL